MQKYRFIEYVPCEILIKVLFHRWQIVAYAIVLWTI